MEKFGLTLASSFILLALLAYATAQTADDIGITVGATANTYESEVSNTCSGGFFRTGLLGDITDNNGTTWTVPAPVAGGFTNIAVYDECTGSGANDYESQLETQVIDEDGTEITAYLFADNYYEFYVNSEYAGRDAVNFIPFDSLVAHYQASYPITYAVSLVDWESFLGTGLEPGRGGQGYNIGDGGFIATFSDGAATNSDWVCKTFYISPLDNAASVPIDANGNADSSGQASTNDTVACFSNDPENTCQALHLPLPDNWMSPDFDDSAWLAASTYVADDITGAEAFRDYEDTLFAGADFIWTNNLRLDNHVVCRMTVEAP